MNELETSTYDREISQSFSTLREMIHDRKLGNHPKDFDHLSGNDVVAIGGGKLIFHIDDTEIGYRIIYDMSSKFKLPNVRKLIDPKPDSIEVVIIVVKEEKPATAVLKSVKELSLQVGVDVEIFNMKKLQFNIAKHVLVPTHEPIRDESQIRDITNKLMVHRTQLPSIFTADPMAEYLALKPGQLVRVTSNSPTAGLHVSYRCCVRAP